MADESIRRRLGVRARRLRIDRGLKARQVAERSGLSVRFLAQVEAGEANISISRLSALADALGTTAADLISGDGADLRARRRIALLGLRGAGKSTLGAKLAKALRVPFIELDDRIEEAAGLELSEIFALHGEAYYRRLEAECLEALIREDLSCVVAMPGGIVHNEQAAAPLFARCVTVWLKARPEDHMRRVLEQGDRRPMANRVNAMAELRSILAARRPLYRRAEITLDTSAYSPARAAQELARAARASIGAADSIR